MKKNEIKASIYIRGKNEFHQADEILNFIEKFNEENDAEKIILAHQHVELCCESDEYESYQKYKKLMLEVQNHTIDCIIIKNFAAISNDINILETFFCLCSLSNVRVISLDEKHDSGKFNMRKEMV